jgi:hypothetical protein
MIETGGTERRSGRSFIADEVTLVEASMSCHMVMRDLLEAGVEELTAMLKVLGAPG